MCVKLHTVCKVTHCVQSYTLCVKLHTEYKSSFTFIVKNSPHLNFFTPTPWLTNMRYAFECYHSWDICLCLTTGTLPDINPSSTTKIGDKWRCGELPSTHRGCLHLHGTIHAATKTWHLATPPNILPHLPLTCLHFPTAYRGQHFEKPCKFGHFQESSPRRGSMWASTKLSFPLEGRRACHGVCEFQGNDRKVDLIFWNSRILSVLWSRRGGGWLGPGWVAHSSREDKIGRWGRYCTWHLALGMEK